MELNLILKYSPFDTKEKLLSEFEKIDGSSGTMVLIFNMILNDKNKAYIEIDLEKKDIIIPPNETSNEFEEQVSFRSYVAILYTNPKMKIYIENSKVRTRILDQTLYLTRAYKFTKTFNNSSKEEIESAQEIVKKST
jgi:hypothetical protein